MSTALVTVLDNIQDERSRQDAKWGEQNHPSLLPAHDYGIPSGDDARARCERAFKAGYGTWGHILIEEIGEAFDEWANPDALRTELVQCAAVIAAWVEYLDRQEAQ